MQPCRPGCDASLATGGFGAVAPGQGEARSDSGQVILQSLGEAGQLVDATVGCLRYPSLEVPISALPDHGEKGMRQPMCPRDTGIHLAELVQIRLRISGPLGRRTHHDERHHTGGRPLRAGVGRALGLQGVSRLGGASQPG
jgi:hypothetical protein